MICTRLVPVALLLSLSLCAADEKDSKKPEQKYEMTTYVLGMLRKGPNWGQGPKEESDRIQAGHIANIRKMAEAGKLIVAGPMQDDTDLRGILIFRAKSPDEVREMANQDPAVKSGRLVLELHPWFAADGLRVNDFVSSLPPPQK